MGAVWHRAKAMHGELRRRAEHSRGFTGITRIQGQESTQVVRVCGGDHQSFGRVTFADQLGPHRVKAPHASVTVLSAALCLLLRAGPLCAKGNRVKHIQ
jgi:hypothetical protein